MSTKPVIFNNTVLRDGHQSMAATRMTTAQMLPAASILDSLGFGMLETWGGATIDSCLRFLKEQPFDRIRALRKHITQTPQGMLLRGQNIVQYSCFPDDVVEAFVQATADAGMEVFRIFDALNDIRNVESAIRAVIRTGKHARGEICYTTSPVHTTEAFVKYAYELKERGCHSLGIKDMAGVIMPHVAVELVKALQKTGLPVTLHTHDTAGIGSVSCYAATLAGIETIETSISPFSNGTSQPDTLRMLAMLEGYDRCPNFDIEKLKELRSYFTKTYEELSAFTSHKNEVVESDTLIYQVPGGMLSNFRVQLKELNMSDRFDEVLAEIPTVRKALGWPPLVTPISQIVGTQATLNVKFGAWKNFAPQAMDIALGNYGKTPGPIDPEVLALAEKNTGKQFRTSSPAQGLAPRMSELKKELETKGLPSDKEACVLYAMFPREYSQLMQTPQETTPPPAPLPAQSTSNHMRVAINDQFHNDIVIEEIS